MRKGSREVLEESQNLKKRRNTRLRMCFQRGRRKNQELKLLTHTKVFRKEIVWIISSAAESSRKVRNKKEIYWIC